MTGFLTRRRFLVGGTLGAGVLALGGCDALEQNEDVDAVLRSAEKLTMEAQRLLLGQGTLAREFSPADISPTFRVNGTQSPDSEEYAALHENGFANWRLKVDGLVNRPMEFSLADLRKLPSRTQITRHDCVEGWSAIGQWTGTPLGLILQAAEMKTEARFVVFHCADELEKTLDGSGVYYESIDLVDAFHPQTILAYAMNGEDLTVGHGAPLRLRVERQLGYKHAKYVMHIEIVDSFSGLWGGRGGFWEDRGYQWYAGI
ncbi:molybdopterin-binding protein [Aurantimonas endophytica]|uniref:DMSO/TMAO reductase YedYZ molybdopterin-dependent catalytic subunit n=1 Tax=Aurantimonas endophytica TaxID=1522175 RepID=A0A7W6MR57_9HYPH|nr:molybdopterin-binding protein [Aurantimonas endophytica]MBB4004623.1 DMSO/TMAO reductase YedYZ molybdopterin-dependent catalytic subunit [Aurantimonas endophytica]MCO6405455.1 molybdopterin-dependent oxidoreductase [Aurantimonas endophytica]